MSNSYTVYRAIWRRWSPSFKCKVKGWYVIFTEYVITKLTEECSRLCDCWRADRVTDALAGVCVCVCLSYCCVKPRSFRRPRDQGRRRRNRHSRNLDDNQSNNRKQWAIILVLFALQVFLSAPTCFQSRIRQQAEREGKNWTTDKLNKFRSEF